MNNIKQREKFDDYEVQDKYDLSDGVCGRFYEAKNTLPNSYKCFA